MYVIRRRQVTRARSFHDNRLLHLELSIWRPRLVKAILMFGFALVVGRAFYLQVIDTHFLQGKGQDHYLREIETRAARGRIQDRNGELLALSTPVRAIWASTYWARQMKEEQVRQLAQLLQMDRRRLSSKLRRKRAAVELKRNVDQKTGEKISSLRLPGVYQEQEYQRQYPYGTEVAHVLGITGRDHKGLEGLELAFQEGLQGKDGSRKLIKDRRGRFVQEAAFVREAQQGGDIQLSIDMRIQHMAYSQLNKALKSSQAKAGSAIVLDSQSGEILALVNFPGFNPNDRRTLQAHRMRNRAVTDHFEPGSTLKPLVVALAIESLPNITPKTVFDTRPGKIMVDGKTISDSHPKGKLTLQEVIMHSSNVGMVKLVEPIAPRVMWKMYDKVGFGRRLQVGYPGEAAGKLRDWRSWRPLEKATMSYGHGIAVTLLQLAHAYMPFAREGETLPLSVLKREKAVASGQGVQVFRSETVQALRSMLEMAVSDDGTAPMARVEGYRVGGKTGTAYKVKGGKYVEEYVSSFVGIAPLSNPRLIVAVLIDEPGPRRYYGGDVAAPAFSAIMERALRVLAVPHDNTPVENSVQRATASRG